MKSKRKEPRQARAKVTLDAIVEATAQVLVDGGYVGLTTTKVARRAGVSVGTLYQYFADKEALVRALSEREHSRIFGHMASCMLASRGQPLRTRIRDTLGAVLQAKAERAELTTALSTTMLEVDGPAYLERIHAESIRGVQTLLAEHADEIEVDDPELSAFVVVNTIDGVIGAAVATRADRLDDPALLDALTRLIHDFVVPRAT